MLVLFLILLLAIIAFFKTDVKDKFIKPKYEDVIKSDIDYDSDGLDDYTDILNGAKDFISKKPKYKSKYYDGGYPTDEYRVCTDIIWYALKNAGYDFKTLIDEDIKNNKDEYDEIKVKYNLDKNSTDYLIMKKIYGDYSDFDSKVMESWNMSTFRRRYVMTKDIRVVILDTLDVNVIDILKYVYENYKNIKYDLLDDFMLWLKLNEGK